MNKAAALAITAELLAITAAAASGITAALDGQGSTALQCLLTVSLLLLPTLLGHFTRIKLPALFRLIAVAFCLPLPFSARFVTATFCCRYGTPRSTSAPDS